MSSNPPQGAQPVMEHSIANESAPLWQDRLAARLRGFGPLGLLAIFFILLGHMFWVPLAAAMVLVWTRLSRTPWREIGLVRPESWARSVVIGLVFGIAFKFLMKAVVMPLLGADPVNHAFHYLAGNRGEIPWFLLTILGAGLGEEIVFRGYAFERLGKLFGSSVVAKGFFVVATSLWFGWAHYANQGWAGSEQAAIVGCTLAVIFAVTERLFMPMVAHTAFDLTAYAMIYWDLETRVAHLIFK